jgi:hypothetical protein
VAKFFKCLLCGLVGLWVARSHRQARELELLEKPADVTLGDLDIEPRLDLGLKIKAAPAHHMVHVDIRTFLDQPRQLGQLRGVQPGATPRPRPVAQAVHARLVVADHPVPQRLAVHAASSRRRCAGGSLQHQGQRHQAARLIAVLRPPRFSAQLLCRQIGPSNRQCHDDPPQRRNR